MNRQYDSTPRGMSRRHFMVHVAATGGMATASLMLGESLRAQADQLKRNRKSVILLWMGGGPATIDLWDMKPGAPTGGPFQPIRTTGDVQICEHLPLVAKQMHHLSIVRSMSTIEADHDRGRYYLHTGFRPAPGLEHPSYGSVVAHELAPQRADLEIPPFIAIGGSSAGPGFLGMSYAPLTVTSDGRIRNLEMEVDDARMRQRAALLNTIESGFNKQNRGAVGLDHKKVLDRAYQMLTSNQVSAFNVTSEPDSIQERYGNSPFGRGCLMARRLVESGVPFVEVDLGGWDNHQGIFPILQEQRLPVLDQAMSALVEDLAQRELLANTVILWMGEFGRTPTINANAGRDHYARAWSVVLGGAGLKPGIAVGETDAEGRAVTSESFKPEDLMATVCKSLGISLETTYQSKDGRPMKIANGGKLIRELFM